MNCSQKLLRRLALPHPELLAAKRRDTALQPDSYVQIVEDMQMVEMVVDVSVEDECYVKELLQSSSRC